jgi:hypothetical protein
MLEPIEEVERQHAQLSKKEQVKSRSAGAQVNCNLTNGENQKSTSGAGNHRGSLQPHPGQCRVHSGLESKNAEGLGRQTHGFCRFQTIPLSV